MGRRSRRWLGRDCKALALVCLSFAPEVATWCPYPESLSGRLGNWQQPFFALDVSTPTCLTHNKLAPTNPRRRYQYERALTAIRDNDPRAAKTRPLCRLHDLWPLKSR